VDVEAAEGGLQRFLAAELARFPAKAGIYVKHLTTGEEAAVRGDETFNSASVIKIPVMTLAYQLAEQGRLNLDARVEMRKADLRGGSGVLRYHDVGLQPTVRDLITQMIIVVAFLTNAIREPYAELEDRMGRTTRAIVDYFDGIAPGSL
jgi:beta-lactamase class A